MFWPKLIAILLAYLILHLLLNKAMRNWLHLERKKFFSYNFVNDVHKKGEWLIRITFVCIYILMFFLSISDPTPNLLLPSIILIFSIISTDLFRAVIEWKYSSNPKDYILTFSQLGLNIVFLFIVYNWFV
ncbi:DUF4181 domain-containing protein [Bacillus pakistanensis]